MSKTREVGENEKINQKYSNKNKLREREREN